MALISGGYLWLTGAKSTVEVGVQVGSMALDLDAEGVNGTRFVLSKQRGKIVVIEFMTTWCGFCESQVEILKRVSSELSGVVVVSIDVDVNESPSQLLDWASDEGVTWFVGHAPEAGLSYKVSGVPTVIVVDREGIIRYRGYFTQLDALRSVIRQIQ